MRLASTLLALAAVTGTLTTAAIAQEQSPPASEATAPASAPATASHPSVPSPGATMDTVRAKFGAPAQELPAVGQPPITRWEYPGYVVYFEKDKVLHTVIEK